MTAFKSKFPQRQQMIQQILPTTSKLNTNGIWLRSTATNPNVIIAAHSPTCAAIGHKVSHRFEDFLTIEEAILVFFSLIGTVAKQQIVIGNRIPNTICGRHL